MAGVYNLPVTVENGKRTLLKHASCHRKLVSVTNCNQVKTLVGTTARRSVSKSSCKKKFGCANQLLHQLCGWLVLDDLAGLGAECTEPGMAQLHVVCVLVWMRRASKFLEATSETGLGTEMMIQFPGSSD